MLQRVRHVIAAFVVTGCTASHTATPEAGHFAGIEGGGSVSIRWSIPEDEQPPLLEGAAGVLSGAALAEFDQQVGVYLSGSSVVYEGTLLLDRSERLDVMVTWITLESLALRDVVFDHGAHELGVYAGSSSRRAGIWQDRTWETYPRELLPATGFGSAWLDVETATGSRLLGRCADCMTILTEPPVDAIVVSTNSVDPEHAAVVPFHVDAELARVAPEAWTPERFARLSRAFGDEAGEARAHELVEVSPGVWEREHVSRTYLRCKEGGSRLVDYRTTWRLQPDEPTHCGIGDIEVFAAAACEAFDYGGGS